MTPGRFLLDETISPVVAGRLRDLGHDADSVAADPGRRGLPDEEILTLGATTGRVVVTRDVRDFLVLDRRWRSEGRGHAGLVLVASRSFPQSSAFVGAVVTALDAAADNGTLPGPGAISFLAPTS